MEVERYSARNLKEREARAELERRRQHEAQHSQLVAAQKSQEETQQFTAGGSLGGQVCVCGGVTPDIQGPRIRKTSRDYRGGGVGGCLVLVNQIGSW